MLFFRPYTEADRESVLQLELREADQNELMASVGCSGSVALGYCLEHSRSTVLIYYHGTLIGLCGVGEFDSEIGVPWLLGSDQLDRLPLSLVKWGRQFVTEWLNQYKTLVNFVDTRHTKAIQWLKHIGFAFAPERYASMYDPSVFFHQFYIHRKEPSNV